MLGTFIQEISGNLRATREAGIIIIPLLGQKSESEGVKCSDLGCKAVQTGSEFASCFGTDLGKMGGERQMDDTPVGGHTDGRPLRGRVATTWSLRIWPEKQLQGPAPSTFVLTKIRSSELNTHTRHVELYFLFKFGRKGKPQGGKENVLFFSTDLNSKESKECDSLPIQEG